MTDLDKLRASATHEPYRGAHSVSWYLVFSPAKALALLDRVAAVERERDEARADAQRRFTDGARFIAERDAAVARAESAEEACRTSVTSNLARVNDQLQAQLAEAHSVLGQVEAERLNLSRQLAECRAERDKEDAVAHRIWSEKTWRAEKATIERETAEDIATFADKVGAEYDASAFDSTDWYLKAAKLLRDLAADIRTLSFKRLESAN